MPVSLAGAAHRREHVVHVSARERAVAARYLAHDDTGPDLALTEVVRRRQCGHVEVREDLVLMSPQVLEEARVVVVDDVAAQEPRHSVADLAAPACVVVRRHRHRERLEADPSEQQALDGMRDASGALLLHLEELGAATQKMRRALALATRRLDVGGPAVDAEHAAEVGAEDLVHDVTTATQADRVHRDARLRRRKHPEPRLRCGLDDIPARLVSVHDFGLPHEADERGVRRQAALRDAVLGANERAGADAEPEREHEDADDLAVRGADALLDVDGQAPRSWADLDAGGAVRGRHLLGVAAADALVAPHAPTALVLESRRLERNVLGQVDDDLRRDVPHILDVTAAAWAARERDEHVAVNALWRSAVRGDVAVLAPRPQPLLLPTATTKRPSLSLRRALCFLHLLAQRLVLGRQRLCLSLPARALALRSACLRAQLSKLSSLCVAGHALRRSCADPETDRPLDRWRRPIPCVRTPPRTVNTYSCLSSPAPRECRVHKRVQ